MFRHIPYHQAEQIPFNIMSHRIISPKHADLLAVNFPSNVVKGLMAYNRKFVPIKYFHITWKFQFSQLLILGCGLPWTFFMLSFSCAIVVAYKTTLCLVNGRYISLVANVLISTTFALYLTFYMPKTV